MSQSLTRARQTSSGISQYFLAFYYVIIENLSLSIVGLGIIVIGMGPIIEADINAPIVQALPLIGKSNAVVSGMFGVWGASLVLFGLFTYVLLLANQLVARVTD